MQQNITIVGGLGQMGQLFSKLWKQEGYIVNTLDKHDWDNANSILPNSDLVVICVPINQTLDIIAKVAPYLKQSTILADMTSIKSKPLEAMLNLHTGSVLGLHPMFGPTIETPNNQIVINCHGRGDVSWVIDSIRKIGFTIQNMDATDHDKAMDFIQGLEHFSTFVLGSFLKSKSEHPHELLKLASPIYQAKLALMGRIFDQDATLYADIISADNNRLKLIEEFGQYFNAWISKLTSDGKDEFINEFITTSKWMGDFTHQSQIATDEFLDDFTNNLAN